LNQTILKYLKIYLNLIDRLYQQNQTTLKIQKFLKLRMYQLTLKNHLKLKNLTYLLYR
jgi:hypothetical protein